MCPRNVSTPQSGKHAIPMIDIGPLRDGTDPVRVAQALHGASHGAGFFYVVHHAFDAALLQVTRRQALTFSRQANSLARHLLRGSAIGLGLVT